MLVTVLLTDMVDYSALNSTANFVSNSEIAFVRYAYVTIGAVIFVASVFYAVAYWLDHYRKYEHSQQILSTQQTTHKEHDQENSDNKSAEHQK